MDRTRLEAAIYAGLADVKREHGDQIAVDRGSTWGEVNVSAIARAVEAAQHQSELATRNEQAQAWADVIHEWNAEPRGSETHRAVDELSQGDMVDRLANVLFADVQRQADHETRGPSIVGTCYPGISLEVDGTLNVRELAQAVVEDLKLDGRVPELPPLFPQSELDASLASIERTVTMMERVAEECYKNADPVSVGLTAFLDRYRRP